MRSGTFFISPRPNRVVGGPVVRSRFRSVSPDWSVLTSRTRFPSGDQLSPPMELSSLASKSFRAWSPLDAISQISRSPSLPLFVPKEIREPSGETDQATALSRSLRSGPPRTETSQILLVCDDQSFCASATGWELTTNRMLSGNHVPTISQFTCLPL